jgi:SRSO17 transposase
MQKFIGQSPWDCRPLIAELASRSAMNWASRTGCCFDPSGFKKQGKESVGVARQWCGRLGKIDNCQVGIYLGYVSRKEHALVDVRLYLNKEWAKDKRRRKKCGVPAEIRFRTRHALALEMLAEHKTTLPHAWIAGDDEMGRSSAFRRDLRALGEQYLLAVPSNTLRTRFGSRPPVPWSRTSSAGPFPARGPLARGVARGGLDND